MIEIITDYGGGIPRMKSQLYSLDYALRNRRTGELGVPIRVAMELYGYEHVGKSTLSKHLTAAVDVHGHVLVMNVDEAVPDVDYDAFIMGNAGFDGTLEYISHLEKKKVRSHESMLSEVLNRIRDGGATSGILDSVGAFSSSAEVEDELGKGYAAAKRAATIGESARKAMSALRFSETDGLMVYVNHMHAAMGGRGHRTPGGQGLKNQAAIRIRIWRDEHKKEGDKKFDEILGYIAKGYVEKNRYGGKGGTFRLFFLEGKGLHLGMTAIYDCESFGLAELGSTVKLKGESMGYINATFLDAALKGETEPFAPFFEALEDWYENFAVGA